ncbi:MAG: hypothetical protein KDA58_03920, partial [Planctomycetaceae bacterium]|nr:hypothetical protein [Planctomycetaceae bacterium]
KKVVPNVGHGHFTLILKDETKTSPKALAAMQELKAAIVAGLTQPKTIGWAQPTELPGPQGGFEATVERTIESPRFAPAASRHPRQVVFLVHGIRDFAEWQATLGAEIQRLSPEAIIVPVTYGYFTALQFLYRTSRKRAMRVFVDRYTQARAEHRGAIFHVACHSNGTWVVAHALKDNLSFRIKNLYLCGSVLSRTFPWHKLQGSRITGKIRNDCANQDWPVGVLCSILSWIPLWWDLGSGGVDGFQQRVVTNNQYLQGHHGIALTSTRHEEIAQFLLGMGSEHASRLTKRGPFKSRLLYISAVVVVVGLIGLISTWIPWLALQFPPQWQQPALLSIWTLWVIFLISRLVKL